MHNIFLDGFRCEDWLQYSGVTVSLFESWLFYVSCVEVSF